MNALSRGSVRRVRRVRSVGALPYGRAACTRGATGARRGVASILSMMILILFGSLAAAMAIASQGNLRTAASHLHVVRALGAAETGLALAQSRLAASAACFVVERGRIDSTAGAMVWTGSLSGLGEYEVIPLDNGQTPSGIADALVRLHSDDGNLIVVDSITSARLGTAPVGLPGGVYQSDNWVVTPAVGLTAQPQSRVPGSEAVGTAFQITYAPLADSSMVRAIVTGYDFEHRRNGVPITRTIMQDFQVVKRVDHAVVSPSRIMIGKNVLVSGDLGATYAEVQHENGNPLVLRSDFRGLDEDLDEKLEWLARSIADYDVDGDNRLRVGHRIESQGLSVDTDGDLVPDYTFADTTGDKYVDEFDEFMRHYDANGDGKVALSDALREGTPHEALAAEFIDPNDGDLDEDMALLIDSSNPDRNRNGVYGFADDNNNGVWDPGEAMNDYDAVGNRNRDQVLGYRDGVLDRRDTYTKVKGRLSFRVAKDEWETHRGAVTDHLEGSVKPTSGGAKNPVRFEVSEEDLPDLSEDAFNNAQQELREAVDGLPFANQVAAQLGVSPSQLGAYVESGSNPEAPQYYRLDPDADGDGLPDNHETAHFEKMPFNAPHHSDWYYRPVYKNMVFRDCAIPMGNNGLFVNCTFVGVTYVRTHEDNAHLNWTLYGRLVVDEPGERPRAAVPRVAFTEQAGYPDDLLPSSALPPNQAFFIPADPATQSLDRADFPKTARPQNWTVLPLPLVIDGVRVVDTKAYSNNLRFHDCLFIGSIISDTPDEYTNVRNKVQFTGKTKFATHHPDPQLAQDPEYMPDPEDLEKIAKSSLMLPNCSVDVGSFNSPPEQDVKLTGAIIAGVMDIRGNATVDGALLLTYKPVLGEGPMRSLTGGSVGNPAAFNTTLGYFGPDDGDEESLDPRDLPLDQGIPIVGWDLDGDGLPDLGPHTPPTPAQVQAGATAVPFHGYGRIELRFNPDMTLPDGIMVPLQLDSRPATYVEGRP